MEKNKFIAPVYSEEIIKKKRFDKIALIDADRFKYLATSRMYYSIMNEGKEHSKTLITEIIQDVLKDYVFNRFEAKQYVFCFSAPSKNVFRNSLTQEKKYKGNREDREDKNYYPEKYEDMAFVYHYVKERYHSLFFEDLEADDIISIFQDENTFVFSNDKDLKQIPGFHFDENLSILTYITKEEAFRFLMKQVLTGDTTDNIPGLKLIGEIKAEKIIQEKKDYELFFTVIKKYIDKYGLINGIDAFFEMYGLVNLKKNRGDYLKKRYKEIFQLKEIL